MSKVRNSHKHHHLILLITLFFATTSHNFSQWPIMKTDADSLILLGADKIYNIEFDSAEVNFRKVVQNYPILPAGYFLDAMIDWWKIAIFRNSKEWDESFLKKIENAIKVCDNILDTNEFDIGALFFKGGALGYRARFHIVRGNWFRAASDAYKALQILIKCLNIAPTNYDIMLGTGIYNYFAEAIPEQYPSIKPIISFIPKGDKKIGTLQLEAASKYARYARIEAKFILLQIYYDFEKNPSKALPIAEELAKTYPNNPVFQRYLGRCYVSLYMLSEWKKTWMEILEKCQNKVKGYDLLTAREALYYIGSALMEEAKYEEALQFFYKSDEASRKLDREGPSPFMISLNLKIGKIFDIQGKRKYAIMQYQKVLSWKNYRDSHQQAQMYLETPYYK